MAAIESFSDTTGWFLSSFLSNSKKSNQNTHKIIDCCFLFFFSRETKEKEEELVVDINRPFRGII